MPNEYRVNFTLDICSHSATHQQEMILVDHSDVAGAASVQLHLHSQLNNGFNGLGKDNYKARLETFNFWDLIGLMFEISRYIYAHEHKSIRSYHYNARNGK